MTASIGAHNIPEGLAVATVLCSKGTSPGRAVLWSIFTSLPQPLLAVPSYLFVQTFQVRPFFVWNQVMFSWQDLAVFAKRQARHAAQVFLLTDLHGRDCGRQTLLPLSVGFAAGCMIWMVFAEMLPEALEVSSCLVNWRPTRPHQCHEGDACDSFSV